jgi:hypothetical protein
MYRLLALLIFPISYYYTSFNTIRIVKQSNHNKLAIEMREGLYIKPKKRKQRGRYKRNQGTLNPNYGKHSFKQMVKNPTIKNK